MLQPIQDDFQHDFILMADEAAGSIVLEDLYAALYKESYNQRLSLWYRPLSCSPDFVTDLFSNTHHGLTAFLTISAGMLSAPTDFPFFSAATAVSAPHGGLVIR